MAEATAHPTRTETDMVWEDPVVHDELFGNVVRNLIWGGFGTLVLARVTMAILALVAFFSQVGPGTPGPVMAWMVFSMIDALASLVFVGALVVASLVHSRMPAWGRVTLLGVSAFILVGSNAVGLLTFMSILGSLN